MRSRSQTSAINLSSARPNRVPVSWAIVSELTFGMSTTSSAYRSSLACGYLPRISEPIFETVRGLTERQPAEACATSAFGGTGFTGALFPFFFSFRLCCRCVFGSGRTGCLRSLLLWSRTARGFTSIAGDLPDRLRAGRAGLLRRGSRGGSLMLRLRPR